MEALEPIVSCNSKEIMGKTQASHVNHGPLASAQCRDCCATPAVSREVLQVILSGRGGAVVPIQATREMLPT